MILEIQHFVDYVLENQKNIQIKMMMMIIEIKISECVPFFKFLIAFSKFLLIY